MKKKLATTQYIQELSELVNIMKGNLKNVMQQPLWAKSIPMKEKIEYIKELSSAKRLLFQVVENEYPEVKGIPYTVNSIEVEYDVQVDKKGKQIK